MPGMPRTRPTASCAAPPLEPSAVAPAARVGAVLRRIAPSRIAASGLALRRLILASLAVVGLSLLAWPGTVSAQAGGGGGGWNGERTLELVQRARERRQLPVLDSSLRSYRADVSGHIYFFIDREANPEPVLLRADQIALELFWGQPNRVKQVLQGMRSEEQLPIRNFRYYLDRYTVIQNGFDDVIRVGEGRDIRNVIHPLASVGPSFYDFRLDDSTTVIRTLEPSARSR